MMDAIVGVILAIAFVACLYGAVTADRFTPKEPS